MLHIEDKRLPPSPKLGSFSPISFVVLMVNNAVTPVITPQSSLAPIFLPQTSLVNPTHPQFTSVDSIRVPYQAHSLGVLFRSQRRAGAPAAMTANHRAFSLLACPSKAGYKSQQKSSRSTASAYLRIVKSIPDQLKARIRNTPVVRDVKAIANKKTNNGSRDTVEAENPEMAQETLNPKDVGIA